MYFYGGEMNKKHSVNSLINMLYILFVIYLMETIEVAENLGIFSNGNSINSNIMQSNLSIEQILFNMLFIGFVCGGVIIEGRDLEISEDENKLKVVNRKLLKYKIFIGITILFSIYLIIKSYNSQIIYNCLLLNILVLFIFYGKMIYFKSYICNRKIEWLKKISAIDVDDYVDTRWWRRKIWFNGRERVSFKYRIYNIIISSFTLFISTLAFVLLFMGKSLFNIFFLYFIIKHFTIIIESVFGLYTVITGKCTGVIEKTKHRNRRGSIDLSDIPSSYTRKRIYYELTLTDFNHKREIKIISEDSCGLSEMDTMEVVHGIFSKSPITVNMISARRINNKKILFSFITRFAVVALIFYRGYILVKDYAEYNSSYVFNEDYNYEEDDPYLNDQKENNIVETLPKDEKYYEKVININEEKSSDNVNIKIEKLYLDKNNSKLQFEMENKSDVPLVLNVPYETHIFDTNNNKNSNILMPGESYYIEMDIFQKYEDFKTLNVKLEYTLSHYVFQEYGDFFYYLYYPLNVVDCSSNITLDLQNGKCNIDISEYGEFYGVSQNITQFTQ